MSFIRVLPSRSWKRVPSIYPSNTYRQYTTTPNNRGGNILLWVGCISLGAAVNHYYDKNIAKKEQSPVETSEESGSTEDK
ncbi:hypothetical protein BDB01DRAFT_851363 [Pilobolus umbonatus]|nr:hypothetical protein BDB01DRAFT_851363 [Pilobolus umbonatus]